MSKIAMEKKQLNFNAPLLSARRYSSPTHSSEFVKGKVPIKPPPCRQQSLPVKKSDWEYEATKPASVPFHWEQIPGRPKGEVESQAHTPEEPSNTPRLPPSRLSDAIRRNSGETPKLPPGRIASRYNSGERSNDQNLYSSLNDHASLLEKLNESLNCKYESDSDQEEDAYSDALETLSQTESGSLNYSVSGLSGCHSSDMKPSGTFSVDTQTRDFMMNRFLPAAKAVVIETPKYVSKKASVVKEEPKQLKKVVSGERKPLPKQYILNASPYSRKDVDSSESENEGQETPVRVKKSGKAWGILPRFCVKNSLCLLNPLPALKSKPRAPSPSIGEFRRRLTRNAHSGPLDKNACPVPHKKKFHSGLLSRDLPEIDNKLKYDSDQILNSRDSSKLAVSTLRRYRSGSISPYRNESPKSPFREGAGFLGVPTVVEDHYANKIASSRKLFKALQDVSKNQINERGSGPPGDAAEETPFAGFVNKAELPIAKLSQTKVNGRVGFSGERIKSMQGNRVMEDNRVFSQDNSVLNILEERKKTSPTYGTTGKVLPFSDGMKDIILNQSSDQESRSLVRKEVTSDVIRGTRDEHNQESENRREYDSPSMKSPLPPPLPKSPSESWLWRTLPSISLGNPFSHSRRGSPLRSKEGQKVSGINTKWETIVKTSNLRHDHVRYSEELVPKVSRRHNKS